MRSHLITWITEHWTTFPVFNPEMAVHDIITLHHDVGIPQRERDMYGYWGDDPEPRLSAYLANAERIYFSDAEMLLFSCMMHEKGVNICFRTHRAQGRNAIHLSTTPNVEIMKAHGIKDVFVVDLVHLGRLDGSSAHYKVLEGGSLVGLLELNLDPPRRLLTTDRPILNEAERQLKRPREDCL